MANYYIISVQGRNLFHTCRKTMAAKKTILDFFNKKTVNKPESAPTYLENDSDWIHDTVLENGVSEKTGDGEKMPQEKSSERTSQTEADGLGKKLKYSFVNSWKTNRPWLALNEKNEMLCKYCVETGKSNSFTQGDTNYRTSTLDRHCQPPSHKLFTFYFILICIFKCIYLIPSCFHFECSWELNIII